MSKRVTKPKAIIVDIEDTITVRHFVSKILFPFFRQNLMRFLNETFDSDETQELVNLLRRQQYRGSVSELPPISNGDRDQVISSVYDNIIWQLDSKLNNISIQSFRLLTWVWAYELNLIQTEVFDDVSTALHNWKFKNKIKLFTYSSGLIVTQQLLLVNTISGNLFQLFDQFFDGSIGDKKSSKSYSSIAKVIGVPESQILFITDNTIEAKAAIKAGLKAILILRPDARHNLESTHLTTISSFMDIKF